MNGKVYLIGAGPGDPGLLTLRGAELLSRSDVILFDGLSNTEILRHAPAATHICVGKHGKTRIWTQEEIIAEMLTHAGAGKTVARLKGGDPAVFARTSEEVDALQAAGIPFEIVPGITAALAAGSYAGIPITHRRLASAVALITGHEEPGKSESALDWAALAQFPGTLVIYMGVTTADSWTQLLIEGGKSPDTPAAIIRRCSLPDQQSIHCRLDQVAQHLSPASKFRPPAIVILGPVTQLAESMDWVQSRPLFGKTILVTRPVDQADALSGLLRDLGANVISQPAIIIGPPNDWHEVDRAIDKLRSFDVVIFCSHNGVKYFLERLAHHDQDVRAFAGAHLAVVGSKTAESLGQYHLRADVVPADFRAEALARQLAPTAAGQRILVVRASRGKDELAEALSAAGAQVTQVVAYSHTDVEQLDPSVAQLANAGLIDWVTITSSATAENLHRLLGDSLAHAKIASLSSVTSKTITELGYQVSAEAEQSTMPALVESILKAVQS
jgi:uroporphyrinogen III methyltransferase / synthase